MKSILINAIILDAGPLGMATNPRPSEVSEACNKWLQDLLDTRRRVIVPEIADYEVRRELIRAGKTRGLARLNATGRLAEYLPLTTGSMRLAAELWARARHEGVPTADDKAIDGDVILAAQALSIGLLASEFIVATDNVAHLSRYVPAARWQDIE